MAREYYFISDLHIGGDGALDECEFEEEIIAFLRMLEAEAGDAELIIAGDMLGLWETTTISGPDKLHATIASHLDLFHQFKQTGSRMRITAIPGNHDHELATNAEFGAILAGYNIHLEAREFITRPLGRRTLWIEHGHQHDAYNRFEDFGNRACNPLGYYVTSGIISGAGQRARNRHEKWLRDIESVYPTEYVPHWLFSNYFYREMNTYIRVIGLPFLLAFSTSALLVIGALLELGGLVAPGRILSSFTRWFGSPGYLLDTLFLVDAFAFVALVLFALPLLLIRHDLRKVLLRYNFDLSQALTVEKENEYGAAAARVFRERPDVAVFVFGHTHAASLRLDGARAILNTGAWIKRLTRVPSRFFLLPDVYCPSYQLGYFRLRECPGGIAIQYRNIEKKASESLSLLQRFSIYRQRPGSPSAIPEETIVPDEPDAASDSGPVLRPAGKAESASPALCVRA